MTDVMARPRRIDIGDVMNRTFAAIGANFGSFVALAFLLAAVPGGIISVLLYSQIPNLSEASTVGDASYIWTYFAFVMIAAFLAAIPAYILMGAITYGAIVHFNGQRASFGECFSSGLRLSFPLLGLAIISGLGYFLWFLLLLVPAILAALRWAVLVPVLVVERKGILFDVFNRSGDLTRDNRWRIFLLVLIYVAISLLVSMAVGFIILMVAGPAGIAASSDDPFAGPDFGTTAFWVQSGIELVLNSINSMILASGTAALYFELRRVKEGTTSDELAKVFE
jgi:hypothetical protein